MKKNFFKKLSFVLALAMIVTALAPAAGAFAAKAPKLNASTKYLYLDQDGKNEFDFNIANKKTGWKYAWSTSNAKVATVNKKNGVTLAKSAGTATISVVISDKDGEEYDELSAKVVVRDNIKELTITKLPAEGKLAVGAEHDFNRSYVTDAGKTTGSQAITRWSVDPSEGATIDDKGVFTATKAGEYTITARAFQSKAKYNSWLTDATKYADYVTADTTYKVTVAASMVEAKQTNLVKFDLKFDSPMVKADVEKNLAVYYLAGSTKIKALVKGVTMSADNMTATVEMHLNFTKGATYVVEYPNMKAVEFVAATTKVTDVTDIAITTTTAQLSVPTDVKVSLYNKDGVDLGADADLATRVSLSKKDSNLTVLDAKKLYMYKVGETATIEATFHTYNWIEGKEVGNLVATQIITCVEQVKEQVGTINAFTLDDQNANPSNFKTTKHTMFKSDSKYLFVELKGKDKDGNDKYFYNYGSTNNPGAWEYTSSNTSVVMVNPSNGYLYAANEGTAVIVVYQNKVQVGACEVTVTGSRKAAMVSLDNLVTVYKNIPGDKLVGVKVTDQLGDDYPSSSWAGSVIVTDTSNTNAKNLIGGGTSAATSGSDIVLKPTNIAAGTYYYRVEITDTANNNAKLTTSLTVTVQDAGDAPVAYYRVETDKSSYDLKNDTTMTLAAYAYTDSGIRKASVPLANVEGLEIKKSDGTTIATAGSINLYGSATYGVTLANGTTGSVIVRTLPATGLYTITATSVSGSNIVSPMALEIVNTRDQISMTTKKLVASSSKTTVLEAINDCFEFKVGNQTLTANHLADPAAPANYGVKYTMIDKNIHLEYVYIYEPTGDGAFYAHKVDMGGVVITMTNN